MALITDLVNGIDTNSNDRLYGTEDGDTVFIHGGNDLFLGGGGNDVLVDLPSVGGGWSGSDIIALGLGDDVLITGLDSSSDPALRGGQEYYGGGGTDTINFLKNVTGVYVDFELGYAQNSQTGERTKIAFFENVTGSAQRDFLLTDGGNNVADGWLGDDYIDGRGGDDIIRGGDGNDALYGNRGFDHVYGGAGNDLVTGGDDNDQLFGDTENDTVSGGYGSDFCDGGAGDDIVYGDDGDDTVFGSEGNDSVFGGVGRDFLTGDGGNDVLSGGAYDDVLYGGFGNDIIDGGAGNDFMVGGPGSDVFLFKTLGDSSASRANADLIKDFQHGSDKLDVSAIDARAGVAGNQAFSFIGDHGFTHAGQISSHYDAAHNQTVVNFNTDSDSAAEMKIVLTGHIILSSGDFIL